MSIKALKSLYYALIDPYFLYCLPVYNSTCSKNLNLLFQLQKRCIRIFAGAKYNAHTDPLFYSLNILPLPEVVSQQTANFMHSIEYQYALISFSNEFLKNQENREYQLETYL